MTAYESLLARVRQVRKNWRAQVWIKGISLFLASVIALLFAGVWGADLFGFKPGAIWFVRIAAGGAVLFAAWNYLYLPLRRRVSDVQIAQFIEERYPQLEDRLVAAVEFGQRNAATSGLVDLLIKDALKNASRVDFSIFINRKRLAAFGLLGGGALILFFALLAWGPSFLPYGFHQLYMPWTQASIGSAMKIEIEPGNAEIAKGSELLIKAQLIGFDASDVALYQQEESSTAWSSSVMEPDPQSNRFRYLLVDIRSSLRYYIEAKGIRSPIYSLKVIDMVRVEKIDLTYNYPAYTGMAPKTVENEGDISAIKGTKVNLKIHFSRPVHSARLLFDNQSTLDLVQSGSADFSGSMALQRSGSYVVAVSENGKKTVKSSPDYSMEAIEDAAPSIEITRPMRDVRATSVEEVFSEIKAEDDIGMGKLELHYSVNGGPDKTVSLYSGKPAAPSVTRAHTFFLEEFSLQPGDLISYYGKAWDNNNVSGPAASSSDIYFIQIRPFEQKYVQNQQAGQPQDGGGEEALSKQQKDIISATFKLIREKGKMASKEYLEGLKSLALIQSRLQVQTQGLLDRFQRRGTAQADENFRKLSEYLKNAAGEMGKAAVDLGAQKPVDALPQEQKSLQQLMRAESLFREIQVSFAAQNSASGGSQANAEDLADLFELELNKLKNQYETIQRGEQQSRDQKVDEALERLKELAQRQQQLNERNRMMAQKGANPSASGGGQGQQQLRDQAEELRRQLQRLSRERSSPQMADASSRLKNAIEEMKKAVDGSQRGNAAEANAQGIRALEQLNDAARKLERGKENGLNQGVQQAVGESRKLVDEQKKIQEELDRLAVDRGPAGSPEMKQQGEDLISRKTTLAERLKNLGGRIDDLSKQARSGQKDAGGKLADASGIIRDNRLPERIMSGNAPIRYGLFGEQKQRESAIRRNLEELNKELESAQNSLGQSKEGKLEEAADKARQLAEGLEAIGQRMQESSGGRGEDRSGQQQGQGQPSGAKSPPGLRGQYQQNPAGGAPSPGTDVQSLSGNSSGPPVGMGAHRDEDLRQLRREFEQRQMDAQELRRLLDRNSTQAENLDKVIESLRRAGDSSGASDPERVARLKSAIEFMRQVEFSLARELDRLTLNDKYFFAEDNEAPHDYQKLVEEYYKSIAKIRIKP